MHACGAPQCLSAFPKFLLTCAVCFCDVLHRYCTYKATTADKVELWWPAGSGFNTATNPYGARPTLYGINVTLAVAATAATAATSTSTSPSPSPPHGGSGLLTASRKVGFRHVALVTINDTNADVVKQATGQQGSGYATPKFALFAAAAAAASVMSYAEFLLLHSFLGASNVCLWRASCG